MPGRLPGTQSRTITLLLGLGAGLLVLYIVLFPERAFQSSLSGLTLWWKLVFPALMPFLMLTELLSGFGVLRAAGLLLQPLLRVLFRLPGAGGWAVAAGLLGGYPAGADAAAKLHEQGLIGSRSAERLFALSHVCNPVTMLTVIGAGMLHSPQAGLIIAAVHYLSAAVAAIPFTLTGPADVTPTRQKEALISNSGRKRSLLGSAASAMAAARQEDGRSFGKLLGDAVLSSIQTLLQLGGFIMLFSVLLQVFLGWLPVIAFSPAGSAALSGLLELHLGAGSAAGLQLPLIWQAACIGAALGWSGLAQHALVLSLARTRRIRYVPFLLTRCLHAVLAFVFTLTLWEPLTRLLFRLHPNAASQAFADWGAAERFPLSVYVQDLASLLPLWFFLAAAIILLAAVVRSFSRT